MIAKGYLKNKKEQLGRPLILDGATGSLLSMRGFRSDKHLWSSLLNFSNPNAVLSIHQEYLSAGADIITANTFRTNPKAYQKQRHEFSNEELVKRSVNLVIELRQQKEIIVAGSNAPAEDCYQKERTITLSELEHNHKSHISMLVKSGCDIIWNETQSHLDELQIICKFCFDQNITYAINLYFTDELKLLSGENLFDVIKYISEYEPELIGFNCVKPDVFQKFSGLFPIHANSCLYFNCGYSEIEAGVIEKIINPEEYSRILKSFLNTDPLVLGSCCGSNPNHTKAIKGMLDEAYSNKSTGKN